MVSASESAPARVLGAAEIVPGHTPTLASPTRCFVVRRESSLASSGNFYWASTLLAQSPFFFMSTKLTETCLPCRSPNLALLPPDVIFVPFVTVKL